MFNKTTSLNLILIFIISLITHCRSQFKIPDVTFEAYDPKGLSISIPARTGIVIFGFHGNINKNISRVEPGEISVDITKPTNNKFIYHDPNLVLKSGDFINYWIFVQFEQFGYRNENNKWVVENLVPISHFNCPSSKTSVLGKTKICENSEILHEEFNNEIDTNKWTIEHYIPFNGPDFEFVSYQNDKNNCYIKNGKLYLKPTALLNHRDVEGILDLRSGCTRNMDTECYKSSETVFILPPVTSARIVSKLRFKFGEVEIKAKLPSGDWIYPQMYLEQVNITEHKLWIAYARGNDRLIGNDGSDLGSRLLLGGPVLAAKEPNRSAYLSSMLSQNPFTSSEHVFKIIWKDNGISLLIDGNPYGEIQKSTLQNINFSENDYVQLVLGVGVGGNNDFPEGFRSRGKVKPWENFDRKQLKDFFKAKNDWLTTWNGENTALIVDYVKITAL